MAGQPTAGQPTAGQPTAGQPTAGQPTVGSGPVGPGPVGSGPVGSGPVGPGPVGSGPVGSGPVGSGPVGSGPVGSGPVGSPEVGERVDGRTARAERTRAAIVDAHLALIGEGDLRPTGERIAERAGVSLRALWTNFKDMETLFEASGAQVLASYDAAFTPVPPDLPRAERVALYCRQRARLLQLIAAPARAAAVREPFSRQLRVNRQRHIDRVRDEVTILFAAELDLAGPAAATIRDGVIAASMWPAWSMLREGLALSPEAAEQVMTRTITALLDV